MMEKRLFPPDGGWGWLVVLGASIVNLSTRSIEPSFGLLFGDLLKELDIATTGASVIMATLDAMINFSGLFVGPLIRKYSFRKVGMVGAALSSLALTSTSAADSLLYILATYSIMGGIGFGLATASTFVALNSYFDKKRGQAVGLAMAGTALGFMAMPQLVSYLVNEYNFRGAVAILGAVSLNAIVGAILLQPVEKHLRMPPELKETPAQEMKIPDIHEPEASDCLLEPAERKTSTPSLLGFKREPSDGMRRQLSVASALHRQYSVASAMQRQWSTNLTRLPPLSQQKRSLMSIPHIGSAVSISSRNRKTSVISNVSHLDFMGSTMHIELEDYPEEEDDVGMEMKPTIGLQGKAISPTFADTFFKCWARLNKVMDFDLLKDTIYLNILFGLSITYVAELNFKTIVPFFMEDLGFTKQDTASALSMMAIADIAARVTVPPILDRLPYSRRSTLMFGCFFLAICRSLLAEQTSWTLLLICYITNGFLRGVTLINVPLVLSEYTSNEKYPTALGLSMVAKGIFIVILGPLIGFFRDVTGSYPLCIHTQTIMIAACLVAWGVEYLIVWNRQRKKKSFANTLDI